MVVRADVYHVSYNLVISGLMTLRRKSQNSYPYHYMPFHYTQTYTCNFKYSTSKQYLTNYMHLHTITNSYKYQILNVKFLSDLPNIEEKHNPQDNHFYLIYKISKITVAAVTYTYT